MTETTSDTLSERARGPYERYRLAAGGVALALIAAVGVPTTARLIATQLRIPLDPLLVGLGLMLAAGFLLVGFHVGRRIDRLSDEARRDPITRVGNRRHWEECLSHEVSRALRAKMPLSLLMLDVDNLKKLNDVAGHTTGDQALSIVGEVLNDTCRSRDIAARFGGDEFAILLPRTRASEARIVAERIRTALRQRRADAGSPIDSMLTVSIGICDLASVDDAEAHVLFEAADRALYAAKHAGRDRVEVFHRIQAPCTSTVIVLDERRRQRKKTYN